MAVHSFTSLEEIREAPADKKDEVREKVLAESKSFDKHIRAAVTKKDPVERKAALLKLEDLYEFKRSHPTVEVSLYPLRAAAI